MTQKHKYKPVIESMDEICDSENQEEKNSFVEHRRALVERQSWTFLFVCGVIFCSFTLNMILGGALFRAYLVTRSCNSAATSDIVGLPRNIDLPFVRDTRWDNPNNRTAEDKAWAEWYLQPELSLVAISDQFSQSHNLLSAQRWPWDQQKGIYFVNAIHNMHCLQFFRRSIMEAFDGEPQSLPRAHLSHCLDVIRDDIMCNADDTLRYTGQLHAQAHEAVPISGIGSTRKCRDWFKLTDWIQENSACYKHVSSDVPGFKESDRYKHCPNGKVYWDE